MKFGFRTPSLGKRIFARTSIKRVIRHSMGLKVPKGYGAVTNPEKAMYNKVYNKTTRGCMGTLLAFGSIIFVLLWALL